MGIDTGRIKVFNNSSCLRDYVFIDDVVQAFLLAGQLDDKLCDGRYFMIGGGELKTILEVWEKIAEAIGDVNIIHDSVIKLRPIDMRNFIVSTSLFNKMTGWESTVTLSEGIEKTVKYLKNE